MDSSGSDSEIGMQGGNVTTALSGSLEKSLNIQSQLSSPTTENNIESSDFEMSTQSDNEPKNESEDQIEPIEHDPHTRQTILSNYFRSTFNI